MATTKTSTAAKKPATPSAKKPAVKKASSKSPAKKPAVKKASSSKPPAKKPAVKKAAAKATERSDMQLLHVTYAELHPDSSNLRATLTDLSDLADSIAAAGLIEPLTVTRQDGGGYRIVAGHRRHGAIGALIKDGRWPRTRTIPVVTDDDVLSDEYRTVQMLIENLQRVDLNAVEEARGYARLTEAGWKQNAIATAVGRHQNRVSARLQLLRLPDVALDRISGGTLTLDLAQLLVDAPSAAAVKVAKIAAPNRYDVEGAIRDAVAAERLAAAKAWAKEHGYKFESKASWQMMNDHERVVTIPVDKLAKALAPAGEHTVTIEQFQNKGEVLVWKNRVDARAAEAAGDVDPISAYHAEVRKIDALYRAAMDEWRKNRHVAMVEFAQITTTRDVAQAAMWEWALGDGIGGAMHDAVEYGLFTPKTAGDDEQADEFAAWITTAANLSRLVCVRLLDGYGSAESPLWKNFVTYRTEHSPEPQHPGYPAEPVAAATAE